MNQSSGDFDSRNLQWPEESGIAEAHKAGVKGKEVIVGVLDTGIDADHQEFAGKRIQFRYFSTILNSTKPYRDVRGFDPHGHGTEMCGVIAGKNIGIAPEAKLYVGAVLGDGIKSSLPRVIAGLEWLLEEFRKPDNEGKLKIINMSIRFSRSELEQEFGSKIQTDTKLNDLRGAITNLIKENTLIISAIGNEGPGQFSYPGAFEEVLAVGAVDFDHKIWVNSGSSTMRSKPNVVGYGVGIKSCRERDYDGNSIGYKPNSGTSIASAYVTGIAALYWSQNKSLTAKQVRENLSIVSLSQQNSNKEDSNRFGRGLVVYKAEATSVA